MDYFLGVDIGGTKSQALIADASNQIVGQGVGGAGNWEDVGYAGMASMLKTIVDRALSDAGITPLQITGAGFGVAGFDWESQREPHMDAIRALGLTNARLELVNDTIIGLIAGSTQGWGLGVVAGTRANCWGRDAHGRQAHTTGYGTRMAEGAGALEMLAHVVQALSLAWSRRGPPTRLTRDLVEFTGARDADDLIEGLSIERIRLEASAAPLIFRAAEQGDAVATETVLWAGRELGSLAVGVIRMLSLESQAFDIVHVGSLYKGSPLLVDAMHQTIHAVAPGARFVSLTVPPVVGGVLLAMEQVGITPAAVRDSLIDSSHKFFAARSV